MRKFRLVLLTGALIFGLCACDKDSTDSNDATDSDTRISLDATNDITTEATTESAETTEGTTETTTEKKTESTSAASEDTSTGDNTAYDMDVVRLVNQKGEYTTVYLLADGRYMDRIEMIYTFDGKETWVDENGVEWNRTLEATDNKLEVVNLVNLRGDYTTVYLLSDGRYIDGENKVYRYDGEETWIDENGVEWNKALD